jgi:heme exporter protein D
MNWASPSEFFAMGGYGLYVWGSFGACLVAFAIEILMLRARTRAIHKALARDAAAARIEGERS